VQPRELDAVVAKLGHGRQRARDILGHHVAQRVQLHRDWKIRH
jgi:hypothetical protein